LLADKLCLLAGKGAALLLELGQVGLHLRAHGVRLRVVSLLVLLVLLVLLMLVVLVVVVVVLLLVLLPLVVLLRLLRSCCRGTRILSGGGSR
jgi:hypothetical protein